MARAGFCKQCGMNVWLDANGGCPAGHGPESITNVYEAEAPQPVVVAPPVQTSVPPLQTGAPTVETSAPTVQAPKRAGRRGVLIATVVAVAVLAVAGIAWGALALLGGGSGSMVEAAADFQKAVYEGDWDSAMAMCSENEARAMQSWLDNTDEEDLVYQKAVDRYTRDGKLVLVLERQLPDSDDVVTTRIYFEQEDPAADVVTVLVEIQKPGSDPNLGTGFFMEMYKDGSTWKTLSRRIFSLDEMKEYGIID